MARQLDQRLQDILQQYHPNPKAAVWDCHGTWVILHKAVELIAAKAGIKFGEPNVIESNAEKKIAVLSVTGTMGSISEWSIGEAAPYNNKNGYPYAMAEKRAKDRVVLKLLGLHGEIYSEDEADDFKRPSNTNMEITDSVTEAVDTSDARDVLISEIWNVKSPKDLEKWGAANAEAVSRLTKDDQSIVRQTYSNHRRSLTQAA